jgi:hypothetical protein
MATKPPVDKAAALFVVLATIFLFALGALILRNGLDNPSAGPQTSGTTSVSPGTTPATTP